MKKLFDKVGKKRETNSLVGKVVLVGQFSVKVDVSIGEGGFATIYRCSDIKSGHTFALKHLRLGADADAIKEVQQEAKTMARLKGHPNILRLHAVAFAGPKGAETDGFMLLDFCPLTLLEVMQRSCFVLDDYLVYEVFQDVVWAVAHMHKCSPPLAHRDLKAENVLKNGEGRWVICDFGSSTARAQVYDSPAEIATEEDNIRRTTTPAYRAPEMWDLYSRQRIDTSVDVWALGVLLYVLAFGKLPFQGDSKLSILYGKYDMPPGRPAAMRSLIQDMLQVNPKDRPDVFQVISKLDLLRNVLSGEPSGDVPPPPSHPQPQLQPLLPPAPPLVPAPQPHSHPHHAPAVPPGPGGAAPLPYPSQHAPNAPQHHPGAGAQGSYPGGQTQNPQVLGPGSGAGHPQRSQQPPSANSQPPGPPGSWPNGAPPPPYNNATHVPAHMQPQTQPHPHIHKHLQQQQPPQTHPSPYPAVPHGPPPPQQQQQQQLYPPPPHLQQQQLQTLPLQGAQCAGPGSAALGQPRLSGAGPPPVLRVPSRQGSFSPAWPAAAAVPSPLPQQQWPAAAVSSSVSQPVDLMDAAIQEPMSAAPPAGPIPSSSTYSRSGHLHMQRRTGSYSELSRAQIVSPVEAGVAAHTNMGFGDDNVDWGEQPAVVTSFSQHAPQQFEQQELMWMDSLVTQRPSNSASASAPASAAALPSAPQPATFPHSNANSTSSHYSPLVGPSPASCTAPASCATAPLPPGATRIASAAAAAAGPLQEAAAAAAAAVSISSGSAARSAAAVQEAVAVAPLAAAAAVAAATAAPPPLAAGACELNGSTNVDGLRFQVQHLTSLNGQLEGRVRQLEGVLASQGSMIQRLASELRALMQQQQQRPPQQAANPGQLNQQQQQVGQKPSEQQQRLEPAPASQQQPQERPDAAASVQQQDGGMDGSAGKAGKPSPPVSVGHAVAGAGGEDASGGGGDGGAAAATISGSPARAAPMGFESEPWGSLGERSSSASGSAIYPPIRYEDLA